MQNPVSLDISNDSVQTRRKKLRLIALVWITVVVLVATGFLCLFGIGSYKIIKSPECSGSWETLLLNLLFLFVGVIIPSPVPYKKNQ